MELVINGTYLPGLLRFRLTKVPHTFNYCFGCLNLFHNVYCLKIYFSVNLQLQNSTRVTPAIPCLCLPFHLLDKIFCTYLKKQKQECLAEFAQFFTPFVPSTIALWLDQSMSERCVLIAVFCMYNETVKFSPIHHRM